MKKFFTLILALVMVASISACGSTQKKADTNETKDKETTKEVEQKTDEKAEETDKLIMATEAGFAPYEYTEDGMTVVGVDVDIANEIAAVLGKELVIQNTTFDGALLAVQQGKVDFAAAGISVTDERKEKMDFTIEYATSKQVIVINKNAKRVGSVEDITAETSVGVQSGNVADFYCSDELKCDVKRYSKFLEAAQDLKNDKIDCIVMDSLPANQMVASNDDLEILPVELFTDKYAIAVQKGNTELLEQLNSVLQKLIDDGKIDEFTIKHTTK